MKIIIYSTHTCPWCDKAKDFFKQHNIELEEIFVDDNPDKVKELLEKSGQIGVPVIDINGKIIIGFNEEKIKELLKIK